MPRSRTFRFTREGKVFLAVTMGVGLAAVNTGNNLLYLVLGLMLSTLVLSGILSEQSLRGVTIARRPPKRAFEGQPCLVELVLHNRKRRLPSYSLSVEDHTDDGFTERRAFFLKVDPGESQVAAYRYVPKRRGPITFRMLHLVTRYPFGLIEKGRRVRLEHELLVYPSLVSVDREEGEPRHDRADMPFRNLGIGSEVAGLRDYQERDEARAIHWRRTASLGRMVVRERHRDAVSRITIRVDNEHPSEPDDGWHDRFEESIRRAASQAARALAAGTAVDVEAKTSTSPTVLPGSAPDPIFRYLALLEAV